MLFPIPTKFSDKRENAILKKIHTFAKSYMKKLNRTIALIIVILSAFLSAHAMSFDLDSIAGRGKFPRFVVNTYRWGDHFFNGYDTTYVKGTGYKFNSKIISDCWLDGYNFILPNNKLISMHSTPSLSTGVHLSYLAVSLGYDINITKLITKETRSRQRVRFGFSCMLFNLEAYYLYNDISVNINRFGAREKPKWISIPFDGIDNRTWGVDFTYFISHKRYSEAAAFSFSRIQQKSAGSFLVGFSYAGQNLNFDFTTLPPDLRAQLPDYWPHFSYKINALNYCLRFGYGYNWVFHRNWLLGASITPYAGIRVGHVTGFDQRRSFSMFNHTKLSLVWNNKKLFAGMVFKSDIALVNDKRCTFAGDILSAELLFGYRFNLW